MGRAVVRMLGELATTLGLLLFAFVGWQLWWTDLVATRAQSEAVLRIQQDFARPSSGSTAGGSGTGTPKALAGDAVAVLRIPRFGSDWVRPVREGTTAGVLAGGVGHYSGTALPGEVGNFATAGHRTTYGKPYSDIDALRVGDVVVVETRTAYDVYAVTAHEIVQPSRVDVIDAVPGRPGGLPTEAVMTLTSCNPRYSAAQRYVVHARLEATYTRAAGLPPGVLAPPKAG